MASACQWLGVAMETDLDIFVVVKFAQVLVDFRLLAGRFLDHHGAALGLRGVDVAQRGDSCAGDFDVVSMWSRPRPPTPTMATFTRSLAPNARMASAPPATMKLLRCIAFILRCRRILEIRLGPGNDLGPIGRGALYDFLVSEISVPTAS